MTSSNTTIYIVEGLFAALILIIPIAFYFHFRSEKLHIVADNQIYKDKYHRGLLSFLLVLFIANAIFLFVYSFDEQLRLHN